MLLTARLHCKILLCKITGHVNAEVCHLGTESEIWKNAVGREFYSLM